MQLLELVLGAGGGQAIEELGEVVSWCTKTNFGDVAEDVGKEATIGFVSDLTFGLLVELLELEDVVLQLGKDFTATELETAGLSTSPPIDEAGNVIKPKDFAKLSADEKIKQ